jgi:hypothetical protein
MTAQQAVDRELRIAREIIDAENFEHTTPHLRLTAWLALKSSRKAEWLETDKEPA